MKLAVGDMVSSRVKGELALYDSLNVGCYDEGTDTVLSADGPNSVMREDETGVVVGVLGSDAHAVCVVAPSGIGWTASAWLKKINV